MIIYIYIYVCFFFFFRVKAWSDKTKNCWVSGHDLFFRWWKYFFVLPEMGGEVLVL